MRRRLCVECKVPITNRLKTEPERLYTNRSGYGVWLCGSAKCEKTYNDGPEPEGE